MVQHEFGPRNRNGPKADDYIARWELVFEASIKYRAAYDTVQYSPHEDLAARGLKREELIMLPAALLAALKEENYNVVEGTNNPFAPVQPKKKRQVEVDVEEAETEAASVEKRSRGRQKGWKAGVDFKKGGSQSKTVTPFRNMKSPETVNSATIEAKNNRIESLLERVSNANVDTLEMRANANLWRREYETLWMLAETKLEAHGIAWPSRWQKVANDAHGKLE